MARRYQGRHRFGRIFPAEPEWLARQQPEPIIEPQLPIIDAHHHLWVVTGASNKLLQGENDRYLVEDYLADARQGHHNVIATVFLECDSMYRADGPIEMRPVGEVEFANGQAAMAASPHFGPCRVAAGIVGHADLTLGDGVAAVLEAEIAATGRFVGIRHAGSWDAEPVIGNARVAQGPGLYGREDFRAGFKRLHSYKLTFDAWAYHPQLGEVTELARAFPEATIVMNHVGGPLGYGPYAGKRDEVFAAWKASMTELAKCRNVAIKLGGLTNRLGAFDFMAMDGPPSSIELAQHWRPFIESTIELFGAKRCLFESNFPVDKMGVSFTALWNAFKRLAAGASAEEKQALFSGTAKRVYRLEL